MKLFLQKTDRWDVSDQNNDHLLSSHGPHGHWRHRPGGPRAEGLRVRGRPAAVLCKLHLQPRAGRLIVRLDLVRPSSADEYQ